MQEKTEEGQKQGVAVGLDRSSGNYKTFVNRILGFGQLAELPDEERGFEDD